MRTKKFDFLGKAINELPISPLEAILDAFPNRHKSRDYLVEFSCADFTSLCPVTQQSDFANIHIAYIPNELCIESKSLKFYLQSFRGQKMFNEEIVNAILDKLIAACQPKWMRVKGAFAARGGISLTTTAEFPGVEMDKL